MTNAMTIIAALITLHNWDRLLLVLLLVVVKYAILGVNEIVCRRRC